MTHRPMTTADLLASALSIDEDDDVIDINVSVARQAVELHLSMGGDLRTLLQPYWWFYYPRCVLSLAFDGDDLDRECRLHAIWCARRAVKLCAPADHSRLLAGLAELESHVHGRPTRPLSDIKDVVKPTGFKPSDQVPARCLFFAGRTIAYATMVDVDAASFQAAYFLAVAMRNRDMDESAFSAERRAQQHQLIEAVTAATMTSS